jgi:hypothetical protein
LTLPDDFLALPPPQRRVVHEVLVHQALARWQAYTKREGPIHYRETVVGTEQVVDDRLPEDALHAVRSGEGIAEVERRYGEPMAALQDQDLYFPDAVLFAYYAIYNFFRKYGLHHEVDEWLIVNQAGSAEEDERKWDKQLRRAIETALRPAPGR